MRQGFYSMWASEQCNAFVKLHFRKLLFVQLCVLRQRAFMCIVPCWECSCVDGGSTADRGLHVVGLLCVGVCAVIKRGMARFVQ